jgi:hypothetical protein
MDLSLVQEFLLLDVVLADIKYQVLRVLTMLELLQPMTVQAKHENDVAYSFVVCDQEIVQVVVMDEVEFQVNLANQMLQVTMLGMDYQCVLACMTLVQASEALDLVECSMEKTALNQHLEKDVAYVLVVRSY